VDFLPLLHRANNKSCLIVGGGVIAQRRAKVMASAGFRIDIIAPEISPVLSSLSKASGGKGLEDEFNTADCSKINEATQYFLIIAATNNREVNAQVHDYACSNNILVNVVDMSKDSDVIFPSLVTRGSITVAISNNGSSPVFSRLLKEKIEMFLPENYGELSRFIGQYRDDINKSLPDIKTRVRFWESIIHGPISENILSNNKESEDTASQSFLQALEAAKNGIINGEIYFIDISHGKVDSLTLGAFRLLQQSEVVLYDEFSSKEIMSLLTRGAKRILIDVSKENDLNKSMDQLTSHSKQGKRVARLFTTSSHFYSYKDECFSMLESNDISFQITPSIETSI